MNFIIAIFISLVTSNVLLAEGSVKLGMWSWEQKAFSDAKAQVKLLNFCQRNGIVRVDQNLSIKKRGNQYTLENQAALAALLKRASGKGVVINALRGDRKMFFATNHQRTLDELKELIKFNKKQSKRFKLSGVKYDVEPYLTDEWKAGGAARRRVIKEYLSCLVKIRAMLKAEQSTLRLMADTPFWWDEQDYIVQYNGKRQALVHHVQDLTDSISLMSYRTDAAKVLDLSAKELNYASSKNRKSAVSVGLETIKIEGKEAFISFHGKPINEFRVTLARLRKQLGKKPAAEVIMIHQYRSLYRYLGEKK